jgi:protease-4
MNSDPRWAHGERVRRDRPGDRRPGWERSIIEKLATESLKEQRKTRRWGIFFKLLGFGYVAFILAMAFGKGLFQWPGTDVEKHTAIVDVSGPIASGEMASADKIVAGVKAAFEDEATAGIILRINSPGGSPVQSGRVFDEVRRLREENPDTPLYAVIEDISASGGYYIAAAAEKIYADKASLVGSIGVRSGGFGFVGTMDKLGVERRLITSGNNKAFLDPFSPVKEDEVAHMETLLEDIHQQFKTVVREGRGDVLSDDPDIFSGLVWTGEQAVENGLVDGIGSEMSVARDIFEAERLVNFTPSEDLLTQLTGGVGASFVRRLMTELGTLRIGE